MGTVFAVPRNSWWAQALQNRLIALVLAMVVIVPLIASPADKSLTGVAALTFEGFAILLLATLLWRTRWNLSRESVTTFLRTGANLPVLLFFALAVLSCALSPYKAYSVQEILKLGAGVLLYFVVAYQFRQSKHLSMLVDTLLFLAIAVSLLGMGQYQVSGEDRASALFGNAQPLGSLLMILLPVVAVIAITEKGTKRQLVAQIATVLTAGCVLLTYTRSAWVGATAGLLTLGLLAMLSAMRQGSPAMPKGKLATQKHKLVLPLMLVVVSAGFFIVMSTQNSGIMERASTLPTASSDASFRNRSEDYWTGAMQMIKERPLTGWGAGQFPVHQLYYTQQGNWVTTGQIRASLAEQAHNFYLQTAAELGVPGLLLMLGVLGSFLIAGLHRVDKMDPGIRHSLLMGSMAAVVAFAVDAISSPSWQFGQVSMFLWLMLGVGVSCIRPRVKAEEAEPVLAPSPRLTRPFSLATACLALVAMMATFHVAGADHTYNHSCRQGCNINDDFCVREAERQGRECRQNCPTSASVQRCQRRCPSGSRGASCRRACERTCINQCNRAQNQAEAACARQQAQCRRECNRRFPPP